MTIRRHVVVLVIITHMVSHQMVDIHVKRVHIVVAQHLVVVMVHVMIQVNIVAIMVI